MGSSTWGPAILLLPLPYLPEKKLVLLELNEVAVSFLGGAICICIVIFEDILAEGKTASLSCQSLLTSLTKPHRVQNLICK